MAQGLIKARRKLDELFRTGVEIRFGGRYGLKGAVAKNPASGKAEGRFVDADGNPDPVRDDEVAMWVQPPSPMHRDMALRDANAARARAALAARQDQGSSEHLAALEFVSEMSEETLYDYLIVSDTDSRRNEALREVLGEDEWSDITELQDSLRVFEEEGRPESDPEYAAILKREEELSEQVNQRERELRDAAVDVMKMRGVEAARKQAIEKRSDIVASQAFMREYERKMLFYSVRDADEHGVIFFESALALANQPDHVRDLIQEAIEPFISDGAEAKNSQRVESGSESSALPSEPETTDSSTPEASTE